MSKRARISVQGTAVAIQQFDGEDYISLTDVAKKFGDDQLIYNWMRNRNTLEFLGIREQLNNPDFKGFEFETFRSQACLRQFVQQGLAQLAQFEHPIPRSFDRGVTR